MIFQSDKTGFVYRISGFIIFVLIMSSLDSLHHVSEPIENGGMVLVLNTGAIITPEDEAMLQALHSRSAEGVNAHLERLSKVGSGKFMENFYVGYGHKSIGDC